MEIALASKRKRGFATGVILKDKTDPVKQEAWETCNNMVISWILGNVNESIKKSIMFMNTARDMWKNFEQRFQITNGARKYQVYKMIYETKPNGKAVIDYYTEMKILWVEVNNMNVFPTITEINPEVAAYLSAKHQQDEEQKLFWFLNGLDDINGAIRSQILMHPTLPTVDEACCTIQQEEAQRETLKSVKEEADTLSMYGKSTPPTCTACGKTGYVKENVGLLWDIHLSMEVEKAEEELEKLVTEEEGGADTDEDIDYNYAGMVTCYSAKVAKSKWILDSSATHHMTGDSTRLINMFEVDKPIKISLPAGDTATVTHEGEANLNINLKLCNVMYVPAFQHNLISIQKLVRDMPLQGGVINVGTEGEMDDGK
ncbi:Retrovirus-related Pol polyprotein from transposon RE1 [Bienertia sinuspersici]